MVSIFSCNILQPFRIISGVGDKNLKLLIEEFKGRRINNKKKSKSKNLQAARKEYLTLHEFNFLLRIEKKRRCFFVVIASNASLPT